jgi:uncharacterized protein
MKGGQRMTDRTVSSIRTVIDRYFVLASSAAPESVAELFSEAVDFDIPGDVASVPWLGRREGRAGVAAFIAEIRRGTRGDIFEIERIVVDGDIAVILGHFRTLAIATNKMMNSDFAFVFTVVNGLITRFRLLEDSYAVSQAHHVAPLA